MEVLLAVIVGALVWLIGPARSAWTKSKHQQRRALEASSPAPKPMTSAAPDTKPRGRSALQLPIPLPDPAVASSVPRARVPSQLAASLPPPRPIPTEAAMSQPRAALHAEPLVQMPITLGVALLLQAVAFTLLCGLGALGYISLDSKARAEALTLERNLTHEIVVLEESLAATRRTLESMQHTLAAQSARTQPPQTAASAPSSLPTHQAGRIGGSLPP